MRIHHNRLSLIDLRLWRGEEFRIGTLQGRVIATPGHTDDSLTYVIGEDRKSVV